MNNTNDPYNSILTEQGEEISFTLKNTYGYPKTNHGFTNSLKQQRKDFSRYYIEFPSAIDTGNTENSMVKGELFLPHTNQRAPLMILVHGMGDQSTIPCRLISRKLVRDGVACFLPYLTIHSRRIPSSMKEHFPGFSAREWFQSYRISVIDIQQIIDWAERDERIDPCRTGVLGISFGGLVSSIAMGVDQRIKAGIFIVSGGNSGKMEWLSQSKRYKNNELMSEQEYQDRQMAYKAFLEEIHQHDLLNVNFTNPSYLLDPMTFAESIKSRRIQMINAKYDKYIPRQAVTDFWRACGKPPIKWFPSGHTSIWLWAATIFKTVHSVTRENLISL